MRVEAVRLRGTTEVKERRGWRGKFRQRGMRVERKGELKRHECGEER
jgi:hypothetical protein